MNTTIGEDFAKFLSDQVAAGRYKTKLEAFDHVSQFVGEEREKWKALKAKIDKAAAEDGYFTSGEVLASVKNSLEKQDLPNS